MQSLLTLFFHSLLSTAGSCSFQKTEAKILRSLKLDSEDLQVEIKVPMDTA